MFNTYHFNQRARSVTGTKSLPRDSFIRDECGPAGVEEIECAEGSCGRRCQAGGYFQRLDVNGFWRLNKEAYWCLSANVHPATPHYHMMRGTERVDSVSGDHSVHNHWRRFVSQKTTQRHGRETGKRTKVKEECVDEV